MAKGDIVLITFPFTDLSGSKLRPAVILTETEEDLTVCFITTQTKWQEETDIKLYPNADNGLKKESLLRSRKFATIDKKLSKGLLGKLTIKEISELNEKLKIILGLN